MRETATLDAALRDLLKIRGAGLSHGASSDGSMVTLPAANPVIAAAGGL